MLKRKINQEAFDGLSDAFKAEYKKTKDNEYVLDTDDAKDLLNARDNANRERDTFKTELETTKAELKTIKESNSNWETLEASYRKQLADAKAETETVNKSLTKERRDRVTGQIADRIAGAFTVPALIRDRIMSRLDIKTDKDGNISPVFLDNDGKVSALDEAALKKEFVDNPDFKSIVVAHKGSGSTVANPLAAPRIQADANSPVDYSKMTPQAVVEHRKAVAAANASGAA